MDVRKAITVVAGIVQIVGFLPYIVAILRRETKPSKASWVIWAVLDTITLAGMWAEDALNGQIVGAVVGVWVVVALAFKFGTSGWSRLDKFCLAGAAFGIALWALFNEPILAIMTNMTVLVVGVVPTCVGAWRNPSQEDRVAWTIFWIAGILAIIAIPKWTLADTAQPLAFLLNETAVMYILYFRPRAFSRVAT